VQHGIVDVRVHADPAACHFVEHLTRCGRQPCRGPWRAQCRRSRRGTGGRPRAHLFEDPYGEEGEEEERVAEGVGGGVVARVRGEGGVEGVRLLQGPEECESGGGGRRRGGMRLP
jgi:hypothetical protein